jgi:hypothetical protein
MQHASKTSRDLLVARVLQAGRATCDVLGETGGGASPYARQLTGQPRLSRCCSSGSRNGAGAAAGEEPVDIGCVERRGWWRWGGLPYGDGGQIHARLPGDLEHSRPAETHLSGARSAGRAQARRGAVGRGFHSVLLWSGRAQRRPAGRAAVGLIIRASAVPSQNPTSPSSSFRLTMPESR